MTRKFLQGLGIDSEIIDKIMDANGQDIEREKSVSEALRDEVKNLKLDVSDAKKELSDFKAKNQGGEDYKSKYEAEVISHNATKDGYAAEKDAADIDGKVAAALKAAGMNEKAIPKALKLYDRAIVEKDKDGAIKNADKVLEHFKGEWGDFFGETTTVPANVATPPAAGVGKPDYLAQLKAARESKDTQAQVRIKQEAAADGVYLI